MQKPPRPIYIFRYGLSRKDENPKFALIGVRELFRC